MPIDSIQRRLREIPHQDPVSSNALERRRPAGADHPSTQPLAIDRAAVAIAPAALGFRPIDRGVLYVGFNAESEKAEVGALRAAGGVRAIVAPADEDTVVIGATAYDFTKPGEIEAFASSLGLDPRVESAIAHAMKRSEPGSCGKLAQIAAVFAEAEKGHPIPSRLVISGHSGGLTVFGDRGSLAFVDLQRLARAMPRAAASIEDVHLAACSTGGQAGLEDVRAGWRTAFPNLKTMWTYAGSSPLAPARHLAVWARATSGPHESVAVPPDVANQHVAVWTMKDGYRDPAPLTHLRVAQAHADARYELFVSGDLTASTSGLNADPQSALADYQTYRVLSQKAAVPPSERASLGHKADQLLRIRYYEAGVRAEFQQRHGADVAAGYRALGLTPPSFARLSRKEALEAIATFDRSLANAHPAPAAATAAATTLHGLRDLDRFVIPESDCHH